MEVSVNGNIPVLMVEGRSLAEAWEKSLVSAYEKGCEIQTEYDKPNDPPSKDCTMTVVVREPLSEPMIHKDLPGGLEDLQEYVMEVWTESRTTASGIPMIQTTPGGNTPTTNDCSVTPSPT
jgi:hypothetical protein